MKRKLDFIPWPVVLMWVALAFGAKVVSVQTIQRVHYDDGTARETALSVVDVGAVTPSTAPATAPAAITVIYVGEERPFKDLQSAYLAAQPGDRIELDAGTYQGGLVVNKPLTIVSGGNAIVRAPPNGYASIFDVRGESVTLRGLQFDAAGNTTARAVRANGKNTVVQDCHPVPGTNLRWFVDAFNCDGLLIEGCGKDQTPTQRYFLYAGGVSRGITIKGCVAGAHTEHVVRTHGTFGLVITGNDFNGAGCRSVLNIRDGADALIENNKLVGNIGTGPLGDGHNLADQDVRLKNTIIRGNTIKYATIAALNVEMGVDGMVIEGNEITLAGPYAVNIEIDGRYAARGRPSNIRFLNNRVSGQPGAYLVKGPEDGIVERAGNVVNGKEE